MRLCFRSWEGMKNIAPYLLEDNIADEKQAAGGSGKSALVNTVVGSAVNVLAVDMKDFMIITDAKFALTDLLLYPGMYRVVHWEDKQKSFPMKYFYNKVTQGTKVEQKFDEIAEGKEKWTDMMSGEILQEEVVDNDPDVCGHEFTLVATCYLGAGLLGNLLALEHN